jgi:hypothetical protein
LELKAGALGVLGDAVPGQSVRPDALALQVTVAAQPTEH